MRTKLNRHFKPYRYIILNIDAQSHPRVDRSREIGRAEVWAFLNRIIFDIC